MFLLVSITGSAHAQQGNKTEPVAQPSFKEVRLKIEWTGGYKGKEVSASSSATLAMPVGQTSMTNNPLNEANTDRKAIFHPELRPDGSYSVDVTVSESNKEQEYPRMSTTVVLKPGETKVVQFRTAKEQSGDYEYFTYLTVVKD